MKKRGEKNGRGERRGDKEEKRERQSGERDSRPSLRAVSAGGSKL
jgi:hypothetical protein